MQKKQETQIQTQYSTVQYLVANVQKGFLLALELAAVVAAGGIAVGNTRLPEAGLHGADERGLVDVVLEVVLPDLLQVGV